MFPGIAAIMLNVVQHFNSSNIHFYTKVGSVSKWSIYARTICSSVDSIASNSSQHLYMHQCRSAAKNLLPYARISMYPTARQDNLLTSSRIIINYTVDA